MMNVSAEPAIALEEPTTRPGKSSCRGLTAITGLALIASPVRETEASVAEPVTPLLVKMLTIEDWMPGTIPGALAAVKLRVTGNVKLTPAAILPFGRLEFEAW